MTTITSVELGATGRYIDLGTSPTNNVNVGAQTIIAYCRPTGSGGGGAAYIVGKTTAGSTAGLRFFISHNSGAPLLGLGVDSSGYVGGPVRSGTGNDVTYSSWAHLEATWDGGLNYSGIHLYVNGTESTYGVGGDQNGSGSINSDSAKRLFLLNRGESANLGREFVGDVAYIARWSRVLNSTERSTVRSSGPLAVPDGLILCWTNQADLSASSVSVVGRSTFAAGSSPPNTALGDSTNATADGGTGTGTGSGSGGTATGALVLHAAIALVDASGSPIANASGLKWAWFDETTPDALNAPTDTGTGATTDGSGNFSVTLTGTTLDIGDTGLLLISNTDGTTTQSPACKSFCAPVVVS